jgi:hypothetical protein
MRDDGETTMLPFRTEGEIADKKSRIYALRAECDAQGRLKALSNY